MGVKKGTDNAKVWRDDKVGVRKKVVEDALLKLSKRKEPIKNKKELVELLVIITGMNRTTFTRTGSKYAEMIYGFLNTQSGAAGALNINDMNLDALRIHAKMQKLETQELKKENRKLQNDNKELKAIQSVGDLTDISDTVMALLLVIERFNDFASLDIEARQIVDTTKDVDDPDRIIASGARTAALFNTLKANPILVGETEVKALETECGSH